MTDAGKLLAEARALRGVGVAELREGPAAYAPVLRVTSLEDRDAPALARCGGDLEALVLDVVPLGDRLIAALSRLPRLRALEVCSSASSLSTWSGRAPGFPSLELLSLPRMHGDARVIGAFLRSLPSLRALHIAEAELREIPDFLFELPGLRELDLSGVPIPDSALDVLRSARPVIEIRTSAISLGWGPGVPGVLRVPDGFPVKDLRPEDGGLTNAEASIALRQVTLTVRWQDSPADGPYYQQEVHGPIAVEDFVRRGPPVRLWPWDRGLLRRALEAELVDRAESGSRRR